MEFQSFATKTDDNVGAYTFFEIPKRKRGYYFNNLDFLDRSIPRQLLQ